MPQRKLDEAVQTPRHLLFREIVARPFARAVAALLALIGVAATLREVLLPEPAQVKLNFHRLWSLAWPWWLWLVVVLVALVVVILEGAVAAIRKREAEIAERGGRQRSRPFLTIEYNNNATEYEQDIADTVTIENIGEETALAITISTEPNTFNHATPRLGLPVNKVAVGAPEEEVVFGLEDMLRRLQRAFFKKQIRCAEVRIPLRLHYADRSGRTYITEYAAVYELSSVRIEDITGTTPNWTDLSPIMQPSLISGADSGAPGKTA